MDLCRILNDDLAATVKGNPKRFVALGTLPMQAPELAVKELERCVKVRVWRGMRVVVYVLSETGVGFPWGTNRFTYQRVEFGCSRIDQFLCSELMLLAMMLNLK